MARALILEDNDLMRRYLTDLLGQVGGFEISAHDQPAEALAAHAEAPCAVAVLDIGLKGAVLDGKPVDGVEVCRRLKAGAHPPSVLLLTAHAFDGDAERFLARSGADAYETKPIRDEDAFLARVTELGGAR